MDWLNDVHAGWLDVVLGGVSSGNGLGNEASVVGDLSFEFSGQWPNAWVWDSVVDVLDGSGVQGSDQSVSVLLDDVESGLQLAQF